MKIDSPFIQVALEAGEALLDTVTTSEFLAAMPLVGTATRLLTGAKDVRDRIFIAKIARFLACLDAVPDAEREKIRSRMAKSPREAMRVQETVLLVLDRSTSVDKGEVVAALFLAFVFGHCTAEDFRRFCCAVDLAYVEDLRRFLTAEKLPHRGNGGFMQYLASAGITEVLPGREIHNTGKMFFKPSPLGSELREAFAKGTQEIQQC